MDEKEAIKRVRNSFKAKKSRAEILSAFQKKGYRLEYAEKIIEKANRPKKLAKAFLISLGVLILLFVASYFPLFNGSEKNEMENPYFKALTTNSIYQPSENLSSDSNDPFFPAKSQQGPSQEPSDVQITPEYISYLLNEMGAWKLRRNPFNLEPPIINFIIEDKNFNSVVKGEKNILTLEGLDEKADLQFVTKKSTIIMAISADDPKKVFKESIILGESQYQIMAGQTELLAKGYLGLYNSLS